MAPNDPILVVDDDAVSCRSMAETLAGAGYRVEAVTDPLTVVGRARTRRYALLVTDVKMPGVGGPELVAQVGRIQPGLPALLVSAFPGPGIHAEARDLGVPLIEKPFAAATLLTAVAALLAGRRDATLSG